MSYSSSIIYGGEGNAAFMAISTEGPAHVGWALKRVAASRDARRLPGSWESRIMVSYAPVVFGPELCDYRNRCSMVWCAVAEAALHSAVCSEGGLERSPYAAVVQCSSQ